MSIVANNISSKNIDLLENISNLQSYQIKKLKDIFSEQNERGYDQTTKQDVSISFVGGKYRFEIKKPENDMYMYQVWKKNNIDLNSDRRYKYVSLRKWINMFNIAKKSENFTPTTLIELDNNFYPTVMADAKIEGDNCVFYFDSSLIVNTSDISLRQLPQNGSYNNIRFDIDDITNYIQYFENNKSVNMYVSLTTSTGINTIFNGILNLQNIDTNSDKLWKVTSFNINGSTLKNNTVDIKGAQTDLQSINQSYTNNYTSLNQPFITTFFGNNTNYNFNNIICNNISDSISTLLNSNDSPLYYGIYVLSNQLLYIDDNNNVTTISSAIEDYEGNSSGTQGLDGKYYVGGIYDSTINRSVAPYDMTSGIIINGYGINLDGSILQGDSNSFIKIWYSPYHQAWNFLSGYVGTFKETTQTCGIGSWCDSSVTFTVPVFTGSGPTVQEMYQLNNPDEYTFNYIPGTVNISTDPIYGSWLLQSTNNQFESNYFVGNEVVTINIDNSVTFKANIAGSVSTSNYIYDKSTNRIVNNDTSSYSYGDYMSVSISPDNIMTLLDYNQNYTYIFNKIY